MVTIDFKLADIKLESSEAFLLKLGKKSVVGFRSYLHFLLKCSFIKYKLISQTFYTCKKINNIFLKFHHSLLWMPTIIEIGDIVYCWKTRFKNITNAHIKVRDTFNLMPRNVRQTNDARDKRIKNSATTTFNDVMKSYTKSHYHLWWRDDVIHQISHSDWFLFLRSLLPVEIFFVSKISRASALWCLVRKCCSGAVGIRLIIKRKNNSDTK